MKRLFLSSLLEDFAYELTGRRFDESELIMTVQACNPIPVGVMFHSYCDERNIDPDDGSPSRYLRDKGYYDDFQLYQQDVVRQMLYKEI